MECCDVRVYTIRLQSTSKNFICNLRREFLVSFRQSKLVKRTQYNRQISDRLSLPVGRLGIFCRNLLRSYRNLG